MKKFRNIFLALFAVMLTMQLQAQVKINSLDDKLPVDPDVTIGTLDNGVKYYVRENHKPENRAELQIVVKCGSVLESDEQAGLAHFTEHMAFNGTKNFPKNELVSFLESTGIRFGADLNANTGYDRTYYMLTIPLDKEGLLDKGMQVLEDWAHNITFDPEELEKERGVILEEWRVYQGARQRIMKKQLAKILWGSKYEKRSPIGDTAVIQHAPRERFVELYKDWYRPDLTAVIAVGDFDKNMIIDMIKEKFGRIEMPSNPKPLPEYDIPFHKETLFSLDTDPEIGQSSVQFAFKHTNEIEEGTYKAYRQSLVDQLLAAMLSTRYAEISQNPDAPFLGAAAGKSALFGKLELFSLYGAVKENKFMETYELILKEVFRAVKHGFLDSEMNRIKEMMMKRMEKVFDERDKTESGAYAREYFRAYHEGEGIPGIAYELELFKEFLPKITAEEVNDLMKKMIRKENLVITISGPETAKASIPTEENLLAKFDEVAASDIEAYVDNVKDDPLFDKELVCGKIVNEKEIKEIGVTELKLSNGIKIVVKPTDFKNDQILIRAFSPGGNSLVSDADYESATSADAIVEQAGLGEFKLMELSKKLTGKMVSISPYIGNLTEGFQGSSTPEDFELALQLVHMYFTDTRKDKEAYDLYMNSVKESIERRKRSPRTPFSDSLNCIKNSWHFRSRPLSEETAKEIDFEKAYKIYQDRFADASDFTFFFIGNVDLETVKPLFEKYLGSLPSLNRKENWKDVGIKYPKGVIERDVFSGVDKKSTVRIVFTGDYEWNQKNNIIFDAMVTVFGIRLREVIREDKGGSYGASAFGRPSLFPAPDYEIHAIFATNPDRVDELTQAFWDVYTEITSNPEDESYIGKAKEQLIRARETDCKDNKFWSTKLYQDYFYGSDPVKSYQNYNKIVESITAQDVLNAAKKYLNKENYIKVVQYPAK